MKNHPFLISILLPITGNAFFLPFIYDEKFNPSLYNIFLYVLSDPVKALWIIAD